MVLFFMLSAPGCVHTIHVNPVPSGPTSTPISRSVQVVTRPPFLEGADHMPGINQLKWSQKDVSRALIQYVQQRQTFADASTTPADLVMVVDTKLSLKSRRRYWYRIRLEGEMKDGTRPIKTYVADHQVEGPMVRWVTASDRAPIEAALQLALDDLFTQLEADRSLYEKPYK
jgi:hypothetical protein